MKNTFKIAALVILNLTAGLFAFGEGIVWGKLDRTTDEVEPYLGEPKSEAEMRADGWKEVIETRDERPIGSMADYKYIWQAEAWVETETTLSRHWTVKYCKDITQVTIDDTNTVDEVVKEVE